MIIIMLWIHFRLPKILEAKNMPKCFRLDIMNKDRTADEGPDLGAYERIEKKDED